MAVLLCENPKCRAIGRGEGPQRCPHCDHKLMSECRKCGADIRSSTDTMCWACGAKYKLPRPLPPSLLGGAANKPGPGE